MTRSRRPSRGRLREEAARGTRRASREFGPRARGYGAPSQTAPGRRTRPRDDRSPWRRQADRSRSLVRFGARHKAGLLGWAGILGALTCMWTFTGVTQLLTVGVCAGGAAGGAYLRHRQGARNLNLGSRRVGWIEQARARRVAGGGPVTVESYTRPDGSHVGGHTRQRPGQGRQATP